jgi:hypothetical protein
MVIINNTLKNDTFLLPRTWFFAFYDKTKTLQIIANLLLNDGQRKISKCIFNVMGMGTRVSSPIHGFLRFMIKLKPCKL